LPGLVLYHEPFFENHDKLKFGLGVT